MVHVYCSDVEMRCVCNISYERDILANLKDVSISNQSNFNRN